MPEIVENQVSATDVRVSPSSQKIVEGAVYVNRAMYKHGEYYLGSQLGKDEIILISLSDGNRWNRELTTAFPRVPEGTVITITVGG